MSADPLIVIRIDAADFDIAGEMEKLAAGRSDIGAIVSFVGLCRDEGGRLAALEQEHYQAMAESEIAKIAGEAVKRWPLIGLTVIHRHGKIMPGENIVLVLAASSHRQPTFEAAGFVMDYLKTTAPFWKKEHLADGTAGPWVDAKVEDEQANRHWQVKPASG